MNVRCLLAPVTLVILSACVGDALAPVDTSPALSVTPLSEVTVAEGVYAPPVVKGGQDFQIGFGLHNAGTTNVQVEQVALAVLNPDGTHAYDAATWPLVTVPAGGSWRATTITALLGNSPAGLYRVAVRGRMAGGNWFDFPASITGVNPETVHVVSHGAFGAAIERIQVEPGTVAAGSHPSIMAVIRNTSTSDTEWQGHATFRIRATVRRNGVLRHQQEWNGEPFQYGETRIGFALSPTFSTASNGIYDVTYEVWSGDDVNRFAVRHEAFWVTSATTAGACPAPAEARHRIGYTAFWRAPYQFRGATPWLAAVQASGETAVSRIDIDYFRLWARIDGVVTLVSANEYDDGIHGGELRLRSPWFGGALEVMPATIVNGALRIRPSTRPERVWHPYLARLPRVNISAADSVWMEVRLRVVGPALVQGGLDYWQSTTGVDGDRLEEAGATDWACEASGWQTLKLERSTEVRQAIALTTSPAGSTPRAGSPISGTFTVRNFDDDTVRLAEIGIETRRVVSSNRTCDPWIPNTLVNTFGPWATNVTLAPGAKITHAAEWIPSEAGTYCLTIVERRVGVPCNPQMDDCYQKTFFRSRRQIVEVAP